MITLNKIRLFFHDKSKEKEIKAFEQQFDAAEKAVPMLSDIDSKISKQKELIEKLETLVKEGFDIHPTAIKDASDKLEVLIEDRENIVGEVHNYYEKGIKYKEQTEKLKASMDIANQKAAEMDARLEDIKNKAKETSVNAIKTTAKASLVGAAMTYGGAKDIKSWLSKQASKIKENLGKAASYGKHTLDSLDKINSVRKEKGAEAAMEAAGTVGISVKQILKDLAEKKITLNEAQKLMGEAETQKANEKDNSKNIEFAK